MSLGNCPECGTELTPVRGRRSGKSFAWCWKCERSMRVGEARKARLAAVADRESVDPYGAVEFLADSSKPPLRLTIGVKYGDDDPDTDIVLDRNGWVLKHPYDVRRMSSEEERAAVGWTW